MTEKEKTLDLATLEWIKFNFNLYSDHSCQTQGYRKLCRIISELRGGESLVNRPQKSEPSEYNSHNNNIQVKYSSANPKCPLCSGRGYYTVGDFSGTSVASKKCPCVDRVESLNCNC